MIKKRAEIHLEFKIEVAASALSNPVCLHGFNPIPLWKVCQGIQQWLRRDTETKTHALNLARASFPLYCGKKIFFSKAATSSS